MLSWDDRSYSIILNQISTNRSTEREQHTKIKMSQVFLMPQKLFLEVYF